jgi:hypothetical protein
VEASNFYNSRDETFTILSGIMSHIWKKTFFMIENLELARSLFNVRTPVALCSTFRLFVVNIILPWPN